MRETHCISRVFVLSNPQTYSHLIFHYLLLFKDEKFSISNKFQKSDRNRKKIKQSDFKANTIQRFQLAVTCYSFNNIKLECFAEYVQKIVITKRLSLSRNNSIK